MLVNVKKYFGNKKIHDPELLNYLMAKDFSIQIFDKEISYRKINYWDEKGYLLIDRVEGESEWRKLSFTDYIWIRLLDELRKMGMSIEFVVKVLFRELGIRENYLAELSDSDYEELKSISFEDLLSEIDKELVSLRFCLLIMDIISFKTTLLIRIYRNGDLITKYGNPKFLGFSLTENENTIKHRIESEFKQTFLSISIDSLLNDFIELKNLEIIEKINLLNKEEIELLTHVRNKDINEVTVILSDGVPIKLEITEIDYNHDISKRIYEDMLKRDYVECSYKTNSQKQVTFKRITKINLNKNE